MTRTQPGHMLVLDASVLIELLVPGRRAASIQTLLRGNESSWHVPHLVDVEITQVLRRFERSGALVPERARLALENLAALDMVRHGHEALLARIWSHRQNLSAYDAAYLTLAEALPACLITADRGLASTAERVADVHLVQ